MFEKNGSQWVRDPENMVDVAKSDVLRQWASVVSFWQDMAKHCQKVKLDLGRILFNWICIYKIRISTKELLKPVPYCPFMMEPFTPYSVWYWHYD